MLETKGTTVKTIVNKGPEAVLVANRYRLRPGRQILIGECETHGEIRFIETDVVLHRFGCRICFGLKRRREKS